MAVRMMFIVSSVFGVDPVQNPVYMMGKRSRPFNISSDSMSEAEDQNKAELKVEKRALTPAAERALAEAEARRKAYLEREASLPKELGGRGGKEPGRYGDWEVKGLTSDF
jgi:hypothetical protein